MAVCPFGPAKRLHFSNSHSSGSTACSMLRRLPTHDRLAEPGVVLLGLPLARHAERQGEVHAGDGLVPLVEGRSALVALLRVDPDGRRRVHAPTTSRYVATRPPFASMRVLQSIRCPAARSSDAIEFTAQTSQTLMI